VKYKGFVLVQFVLKKSRAEKRCILLLIINSDISEAFTKKPSAGKESRNHKRHILPHRPIFFRQAATKQRVVCTAFAFTVKPFSFINALWVRGNVKLDSVIQTTTVIKNDVKSLVLWVSCLRS
jgi:hypothetical protein